MVARIDHERTEREALEQQRQELLKRKQKLIADNKKRRDDLANLDKDLEKFIDVSWQNGAMDLNHKLTYITGCEAHSETFREGCLRVYSPYAEFESTTTAPHRVIAWPLSPWGWRFFGLCYQIKLIPLERLGVTVIL